jgi:cysteine desulfurase
MPTPTPIYLDYAATTPTDPLVVEAMLPYFTESFGNPSSRHHRFGRAADKGMNAARKTIAELLACQPGELVFTGCGSESDNLALRGIVGHALQSGKRARIITAHTEHHAVSHTALQLGRTLPIDVIMLPVDSYGRIDPETLRHALRESTPEQVSLVSLMMGNNEIGTLQDTQTLAGIAHEYGALFHTDAVQVAGQLPISIKTLGVDLLALTAHKFYGPKGVGVLYVRDGLPLLSAQSGGSQEENRRAGTHNVPLIVGMAKALELAYHHLPTRTPHYQRLRDQLIEGVCRTIPGAQLTGHPTERLPNHASFVFDRVNGNTLLMHLDVAGIAASSGSACNTGNPQPSEVLLAMGIAPELAFGSLRLTVGQYTTDWEIERVLTVLPGCIERVRGVSPAKVQ